MKYLSGIFVFSVLLLGLVSTPISFAQTDQNGTNITLELEETLTVTSESSDVGNAEEETKNESEEQSDLETVISINLGQAVANFVHESRDLFEQQKQETKEAIALCRENLRNAEPSERDSIREECRTNLDEIKESYKTFRETYRDAFKAFRDDMKILIHEAKGLPINDTLKENAIENIASLPEISEEKEKLRELKQKMREEIREEKLKHLEQLKKERELERDLLKAERDSVKEQLKMELKQLREELKKEKEDLKAEAKMQKELERESQKEARQSKDSSDDDSDSSDEIENELEIEVEIENGIAKVKVELNDKETKFEIPWSNEQTIIAEIASRTGLSVSEIEQIIEFEIDSDDVEDDDSDEEDDSEDSDDES